LIVCVVFAPAHLNALERMEFLVLDIIYVLAILAVAAAVLLVADDFVTKPFATGRTPRHRRERSPDDRGGSIELV
jgi:hypothetical protein